MCFPVAHKSPRGCVGEGFPIPPSKFQVEMTRRSPILTRITRRTWKFSSPFDLNFGREYRTGEISWISNFQQNLHGEHDMTNMANMHTFVVRLSWKLEGGARVGKLAASSKLELKRTTLNNVELINTPDVASLPLALPPWKMQLSAFLGNRRWRFQPACLF